MAKTTIPAGYIAANAITATELAANSVTAAAIATDAISADIADNAITAVKIAKNAVSSSELASDALSGQNFTGNVTFDTNVLYVDATNNRLGVGTNSPNVDIHISHPVSEFTTSLLDTTTKATVHLKTHGGDSTITSFGGVSGGGGYIQRSNGGGTSTYALLLNPYGGNVGIGTDNPSEALHVYDTTESWIKTDSSTADGNSGLRFAHAGTNHGVLYHDGSTDSLSYFDNIAGATRFTINSSGNVGIGKTPNRSRKLEVAGDINLDNDGTLEWEDGGVGIAGSGVTDTMIFSTAGVERMRIHSSGDISIGSSGTVYKNISSSQSPTLSIDGTFPAINFKDDSGTAAFYGINGTRMYLGGNASTVDLLFYLNDAPVTKITNAGIVSTNCSTNYKGVHIHGSQAPCISFAKSTADETSPEWRIGVSGYDGSDLAISVGSTTGDRVRIDPNGRLLAGIENVAPRAGNTNVGNEAIQSYGPIISGAFQGSYTGGLHCIRDWFVYAGPSTNTGTYLHIKTDLANSTANSAYTMSFFKYRAYCYGGGGNVAEGLLGWHNWSGGYYNVGVLNYNSSWALVQQSYTSSDNYVVLVAYLPASYCHLAIDWDQWGGYGFRTAKVVATTQSNSTTGAY